MPQVKNFRERWVGSTEGNLEKILDVVEGLGHVLLIIDEADRSMGNSADGDGGTTSRVIARLKEFMSDTTHRGRVVMMMMTNRPDKLDADLKRPGRFDLKIPFFFPADAEDPGGDPRGIGSEEQGPSRGWSGLGRCGEEDRGLRER